MAGRMSVVERRALLVDAAIRVMAREGVAATTTRGIVAEAGMPVGAFHYCFHSKDELVLEVMRALAERPLTAVAASFSPVPDPVALIGRALDAYWTHLLEHPLERLLTLELIAWALRRPGGDGAARALYAASAVQLQRWLDAVAETGAVTWRTPTPELSRSLAAILRGVTLEWLVTRDDEHARLLLDRVTRQLCAEGGLQARLVPDAEAG